MLKHGAVTPDKMFHPLSKYKIPQKEVRSLSTDLEIVPERKSMQELRQIKQRYVEE